MYIYIYIHIYIYIYILCNIIYIIYIEVNQAVNRIHEKLFQIRLVYTNEKTFLTNYLLRITFSCYLFILGSFVTFFL